MIIRNNSTFLAAKKREKSKEIIGSLIHNSCIYISCIFLCFSNYCMYEEKNLWSGLHDFKSFLFFSLFAYSWGNKEPKNSVCLHRMPFMIYAFICLSILSSFSFVRPLVRPISICAIHEFYARSCLLLFFLAFFFIYVVLLVLLPFLFFLFLFAPNRV
jgi:hypothetical protein